MNQEIGVLVVFPMPKHVNQTTKTICWSNPPPKKKKTQQNIERTAHLTTVIDILYHIY